MIEKMRTWAADAARARWFAYASILLIQLKAMWGAWLVKDLTRVDTSSYFVSASRWYRDGHVLFTWSPLYIWFYGTLLHFSPDAYVVTMLHRVLTVLLVDVLVLALLRHLMSSTIAWLMTVWWVILPINFDTLYEVHLFGVIPVLAAFLTIVLKPGPRGRGWGAVILGAGGLLIRNELLIAAFLFAAAALIWDWRHNRPAIVRAYGIPAIVAVGLAGFFFVRSIDREPSIMRGLLKAKHTLNICQTYAFGYQQRVPDWNGSPWTECQQVMTRVFGEPEPSLLRAISLNHRAILGHFEWNAHLVPSGLQVLLFNVMSGTTTPDYIPQPIDPEPALLASFLLLLLVGAGIACMLAARVDWRQLWSEHAWVWVAMLCVVSVTLIVMITERPRPSYMLSLGVVLRALVGICLVAIVRRFPVTGILQPLAPLAAVVALIFLPEYYYVLNPSGARPLLDMYRRLASFEAPLETPGAALAGDRSWELCNYVAPRNPCRAFEFQQLRSQVTPAMPLPSILAADGVKILYLDDVALADPVVRQFMSMADSHGWRIAALENDPSPRWAILEFYGQSPLPTDDAKGPAVTEGPRICISCLLLRYFRHGTSSSPKPVHRTTHSG